MRRARLWAVQLIVIMLVFAAPALGQTSWWRAYGGTDEELGGNSVQQTANDGYIIAVLTVRA
jgi:hypothetical protein